MSERGTGDIRLRYLVVVPLRGQLNTGALDKSPKDCLGLFSPRVLVAREVAFLGASSIEPHEFEEPGREGLEEASVMFFRWGTGAGGEPITIAVFSFTKRGRADTFHRIASTGPYGLMPLCQRALGLISGGDEALKMVKGGQIIVVLLSGPGADLDMAYEAGLRASASQKTLDFFEAEAQVRLPMIKALYEEKRLGPAFFLLRTQNAVLYHENDRLMERYVEHLIAIAIAFVALRQELNELREELADKDKEILSRERVSSVDYEDMASYKARLVDLLEEVHGPLFENDVTNTLYFKIRDGCGLASLAEAVEKEMGLLERTVSSMVNLRQKKVNLEISERSFRISDALFSFRKAVMGLDALISTAFSIPIAVFLAQNSSLSRLLGHLLGYQYRIDVILEFLFWAALLWPASWALIHVIMSSKLERATKVARLDVFLRARGLYIPGLGRASCVMRPSRLYELADEKGILEVKIISDIQHHEERSMMFRAKWEPDEGEKRDYLCMLRFVAYGERYPISLTIEAREKTESLPSLLQAIHELLANLMREGVLKIEGVGSVEGREEAVAEAMLPQTS